MLLEFSMTSSSVNIIAIIPFFPTKLFFDLTAVSVRSSTNYELSCSSKTENAVKVPEKLSISAQHARPARFQQTRDRKLDINLKVFLECLQRFI